MQNTVSKTLKIIKNFVVAARIERALLIAKIIQARLSGSKISLYQLGISAKNKNTALKKVVNRKFADYLNISL